MIAKRIGNDIALPGIATAHSHAFQRLLRGRTQRPSTAAKTFWSWRGLMYALAERLDPESIYDVSFFAFVELARAGVTAVGEFHYVHHAPDGRPYTDRLAMSEAVVRAARDAGLRITLLRTLYHRAGFGRPAESAQIRFSDPDVDAALRDVDDLRSRLKADPLVRVGIAPHSVRAVPRAWIQAAAEYAKKAQIPLHMHVSEQPREIDECVHEHGVRPVELLAEDGVLETRPFVGVHMTHVEPHEAKLFGQAGGFACICRSTERDLGDGLASSSILSRAGAKLCTGTDSHASSDPFEEARAIELDERTRLGARHVASDATALMSALTHDAYAAIGWESRAEDDRVVLRGDDPALIDAEDGLLDDAVIYGASPRAVREVSVGGRIVVKDGVHVAWDRAVRSLERAMQRLRVSAP